MATYTVTATSASGTATTSFTDGNVTVKAKSGSTNLAVNFPIGSVERFGSGLSSASNTNCSGPATQTNAGSFNTPSNNQYTNSFVTANNFQSVKLTAPSPRHRRLGFISYHLQFLALDGRQPDRPTRTFGHGLHRSCHNTEQRPGVADLGQLRSPNDNGSYEQRQPQHLR